MLVPPFMGGYPDFVEEIDTARQDYTAACPSCGKDATFTTVARTVGGFVKEFLRLEVACCGNP